MNWTIEKEVRVKKGTKGNAYTETRYVVWFEKGFHAFTNFENAKDFVNNGCKL